MTRGDILLIQPEHILSFRLMVLECFDSSMKQAVGHSLLKTQAFFDEYSRDIVDESDENFSTKFELIYTMGSQRQIEFSPNRWTCVQQVLEIIRRMIPVVANSFPASVEITHWRQGGFPRFRILKADAAVLLVDVVAKQICDNGTDGFPVATQPSPLRAAIWQYLKAHELSDAEVDAVEESAAETFWASDVAKCSLLLLRGLLAGGILSFAVGLKRWRVNYGLARTRDPPTRLAVPYRAKNNPTPRSEFSHPEVVIMLTCLTYYCEGLQDEELFIALEYLFQSDQADIEYAAWIEDAPTMPPACRNLRGLNIKDRTTCEIDVFPHLKFGKAVVDYFLAHIVFPKEMKEFPHKLSAPGWDIGMAKARPTTGFSGTDDSKKLLPLEVEHLDLPRQKHTNALVLNHILGPGNSVCLLRNQRSDFSSDAERLLEMVIRQEPPTQVILDVGAQILELDNRGVVRRWLDLHPSPHVHAAVYVNEEDELFVLDRNGRDERLQTSSYLSRLDECLVFLDEAHTRGIDLKLPKHYRAAVTLGANLTKDRLVQACMRMRKLGKGRTVMFCVSKEIEDKIRAYSTGNVNTVEVADVLFWSMQETFVETRRAIPLWAVQGKRYFTQKQFWNGIWMAGASKMSQSMAEQFLEPEAQSLDERYRPKRSRDPATQNTAIPGIEQINKRLSEFDNLHFDSSTLQEEQERELSPEIEQERHIERTPSAQPAAHRIHPDVLLFIQKGVVKSSSSGYMSAFQSLQDTAAAKGFRLSQLSGDGHLLVTADFASTIEKLRLSSHTSDSYQRSVQWFVATRPRSGGQSNYLTIVSPFEAEQLMPQLHASSQVALHLYKPCCNIGYRTFDKLDFFSVPANATTYHLPRLLLLQLDVFAGQLYINSYEDYLQICAFLGISADVPKDDELVAADGFIVRDANGKKDGSSPVKFLQALMSSIRRNGQGIRKTDIGNMLDGKLLKKSHFQNRDVDST